MTCQITELHISGDDHDALGRPRRWSVFARVSGTCTHVNIEVRLVPVQGNNLYSATCEVDNGLATGFVDFPDPTYFCGQRLWACATCAGGGCTLSGWTHLRCKAEGTTGTGPTNGNGNVPGGGNGGLPNWPWPSPPSIFCPMIGRIFIPMFAAAVLVIVVASTFGMNWVLAAVALLSVPFAVLAFWRRWCTPRWCYVVGGMLWGLKPAFVAAVGLAIFQPNVLTAVVALAIGAGAGMCTAYLRENRCFIPKLTTPFSALPIW